MAQKLKFSCQAGRNFFWAMRAAISAPFQKAIPIM
jgi:hypothetical protein